MKVFCRAIALLIALGLSGCFTQSDEVSIRGDGTVEFTTSLLYRQPMSYEDVDNVTNQFLNQLRAAGWNMEKTWISKTKPYQVELSGKANIRKVKNQIEGGKHFYKLENLDGDTYQLIISKAGDQPEQFPRTILFRKHLLHRDAEILTSGGRTVPYDEKISVNGPMAFTVKLTN